MSRIFFTLSLVQFVVLVGFAQQEMSEGFAMLELGEYASATVYFKDVIAQEPSNKTARICYGRAVGLGGNPEEGLNVFEDLEKEYPSDYEVQLNLAEALMWQKEYKKAEVLYEKLIQEDSLSYVANLGFANANASLDNQQKALIYINKAISLNSENESALVSKKYILLALAESARRDWQYEVAHEYLDRLFDIYPLDREGLLNQANVYLTSQEVSKAEVSFQQLYDNDLAPLESLLGLSYTSLLKNKKKSCLTYAQQANKLSQSSEYNESQKLRAVINEINALAFNRKYKEATIQVSELEKLYPDELQVQLAKARIKVWDREGKTGLESYNALLEQNVESFELHMGIAEAQRSLKQINKAIKSVEAALSIQPKQADAMRLLEELKSEIRTFVILGGGMSSDIGGNEAVDGSIYAETAVADMHRVFVQHNYRNAYQAITKSRTTQHLSIIGNRWIYNQNLGIVGSIGKVHGSGIDSKHNSTILNLAVNVSFLKRHQVEVKYNREAHNYTVDLINSGIIMNNISGAHSYQSAIGLGMYSQYMRTLQSDDNNRNLFFSSIYFDLHNSSLLKLGINYSAMTYDFQNTELYFSPSDMRSGELFIESSNASKKGRMKYKVHLALGKQRIENQKTQATRRIDFMLGYQLSPKHFIQANYLNSNAAQANVTGYSFSNYSVSLRKAF